ncbi:radical SAM/SPASM domain-containing protein [Desulfogranum japonicum]|uniref:radical SAM/SPASM domain-containing protein n=1 Tax=Desulfogranum japonicum TaxID=231447 RepID=UPI000413DCE3|nr:radical SAM protein [Desulfogranum japonicum]
MPPLRSLTLMLTNRCNLSCAYCYHGEQDTPTDMSLDTLDKALDLATKSGNKGFHVQLTGGEATLVPHLIAQASEKVRGLDHSCTISLQTNATRLNPELVELIKKYSIDIGVSLDGPPQIQEQLRGKAGALLQGLNILEAACIPFRVTTVVSQANVQFLPQVAILLSRYQQAQGMGLDLLVRKGRAVDRQRLPADPRSLRQNINELIQTLVRVNKKRSTPLHLREQDLVYHRMTAADQTPLRAFCHAQQGTSLAVSVAGALYPCSQTFGDPNFTAGTVDDPLPVPGFPATALSTDNPLCGTCPLEQCCPGDCPSRIWYNRQDRDRLSCHVYQAIASTFPYSQPLNNQ